MMKHPITAIIFLLVVSASYALAQNAGAPEITLEGGKTGNINFTHQLHQKRTGDCMLCHSVFPQAKGALSTAVKSGSLKKKQVMNKTCLKCHRMDKKAGRSHGPVKCAGCHVK